MGKQPKTRSEFTITTNVLQLPEGFSATGAEIKDGNIIITATPEGSSFSGAVARFKFESEWAQRIEWGEQPSNSAQPESE